jgi:hypothetical protein
MTRFPNCPRVVTGGRVPAAGQHPERALSISSQRIGDDNNGIEAIAVPLRRREATK